MYGIDSRWNTLLLYSDTTKGNQLYYVIATHLCRWFPIKISSCQWCAGVCVRYVQYVQYVGMVMDWIGAGVAPVARPPHCVPVFWAVQCLVSGQGRTCASFSGGQGGQPMVAWLLSLFCPLLPTPCWKWQISSFQPAPTMIAPCSYAEATALTYQWEEK